LVPDRGFATSAKLRELGHSGPITLVGIEAYSCVASSGTCNYTAYDCAIPNRLPLPEKPVTRKAGSGKAGRFNKNPYLTKLTRNNESPFAQFWNGLPAEARPESFSVAEGLFLALPADIDRTNAIACWPKYRHIRSLRRERPLVIPYLRS